MFAGKRQRREDEGKRLVKLQSSRLLAGEPSAAEAMPEKAHHRGYAKGKMKMEEHHHHPM